jgi:large conductance mechanosensitive channel protein
MKKFLQDFKNFAIKGNVIDMAVGVVIGAAFGKIVSSLVADIIMPGVGVLLGGVDFSDLAVTLKEAVVDAEGKVTTPAVMLKYGMFIQVVIDFILVAFSIFLLIKGIMSLKRKEEEKPAPEEPAKPTVDQELLTEIRDLLKKNVDNK